MLIFWPVNEHGVVFLTAQCVTGDEKVWGLGKTIQVHVRLQLLAAVFPLFGGCPRLPNIGLPSH